MENEILHITKVDYENAANEYRTNHKYFWANECPFTMAVRRQFPDLNVIAAGTTGVMDNLGRVAAIIEIPFDKKRFDDLGKGIEFSSPIKIIEYIEEDFL